MPQRQEYFCVHESCGCNHFRAGCSRERRHLCGHFLALVLSRFAAETFAVNEALQSAASWLAAGHKVALGTVIRTWGSAPRPAGSQLVVRDDGAFRGSVSGGCVEG